MRLSRHARATEGGMYLPGVCAWWGARPRRLARGGAAWSSAGMGARILVIGAGGGFGGAVAREFAARGEAVRCLLRNPSRLPALDGLEPFAADAQDRSALSRAAEGVEVVVHATSYPYPQWDPWMREATAKIVATCREAGALLVFPGNVYGFGPQTDRALAEDAPQEPTTRKGRLRAELEFMVQRACDDGRMRALVVRSGDFFGPGLRNGLVERVFGRAAAGRTMRLPGRLSAPHQWAYLPDLARLVADLVALGGALAPHQVVHFAGHVFIRQSDFLAQVAEAAGHPGLAARTIPWWALRLAALADPIARELLELDYLFDEAVILDDAERRRLLPGFRQAPLAEAIAATLASWRGGS